MAKNKVKMVHYAGPSDRVSPCGNWWPESRRSAASSEPLVTCGSCRAHLLRLAENRPREGHLVVYRDLHEAAVAAVGYGAPMSLADVLERLADAAEHLVDDHRCDHHEREDDVLAIQRARELLPLVRALAAGLP